MDLLNDQRRIEIIQNLSLEMDGELKCDELSRMMYSTDASVYQQKPLAVAFPRNTADIQKLIRAASQAKTGLIPRTAGTSLAGQVVGGGIVVDLSRHFTQILEINADERWCRVQPGVIRNELNLALQADGIFFAPETSTSNRAMIGGMVGNNSCGANSIVYGSTRNHILEIQGFLSDGTNITLSAQSPQALANRCQVTTSPVLENEIYRGMYELLSDAGNQRQIRKYFPKKSVTRRNTGYALDRLLNTNAFGTGQNDFDLCSLIAGSEGTLFLATEFKLRCQLLPPPHRRLICIHFNSVDEALQAVPVIMQHRVFACELIDHFIIDGAARNLQQREYLHAIEGSPQAILLVEVRAFTDEASETASELIIKEIVSRGWGYAFPCFSGESADALWNLRRSGLGVVSNVPGDSKPVAVIEDAAVAVEDLPEFIRDIDQLLATKYQAECVHYGHAGSGELHLRPVINLKTRQGVQRFRDIAYDVADIVKRFRGSLSGEHGDGRLRSELLRKMIGDRCHDLVRQVKLLWDPNNVFNPGKIVDAVSMTSQLRTDYKTPRPQLQTMFDFSQHGGMLRAAEMCNGSGDCRKTHLSGGTMCPSYMATRNEMDTTRARANVLRQILAESQSPNPLDNEEARQVMELCLSCKACKRECPSNVDVAKLKAEFLHGYHEAHGIPRSKTLIANIDSVYRIASCAPWLYNLLTGRALTASIAKQMLGFHSARPLPAMSKQSLRSWFRHHKPHARAGTKGSVLFFCDEFTNYLDTEIGIAAIQLLETLGYQVEMPGHLQSGRAAISLGLLQKAKSIAEKNVARLAPLVGPKQKLVGIEPSALLTLVDEYTELVGLKFRARARDLADRSQLVEEFLAGEIENGNVTQESFIDASKTIRLHVHCHQKALRSLEPLNQVLTLPRNYTVLPIPTGCCGMAGTFGYEEEHYDVSMKIGELVLFPTIRNEPDDVLIAATGTSCRQQILDGTARQSFHPIQILRHALIQD